MSFDLGVRCDFFLSMKGGKATHQENIFLGVKDDLITEISPFTLAQEKSSKKFLHANNKVVMPGLINTHTHLAMNMFRGLEDDVPFHTWLFDKILPMERAMVSADFVRTGTELAALESIRFGVTTLNDMYFYISTIADTLDKAGLRAIVSQAFTEYPTPEDSSLGIDKSKIFIEAFKKYVGHKRIQIGLGPHAPYSCNDQILSEVVRLSKEYNARIHIHVSETKFETDQHTQKYSKTPTERLEFLGVLGPQTICAHCVALNDTDIEIIKKTGASISHNPDSNMKLGSGIAPVTKFFKAGIPVGLGSDGAASNNDLSIFTAMDIATKLQKVTQKDNTAMIAEQALNCATLQGAKALGMEKNIGSLEVGKKADFIFVDLNYPHMQPVHSFASQLVYAAQGLEVDTVVCDGQILMENVQFKTLDAQAIYKKVSATKAKMS